MSDAEAPAGELDMVALSAWMQEQLAGGLAGPLTARLIAGGRSNPTYELTDGTREWILRRPPSAELLRSAPDMSREATVMGALDGPAVTVPHILGLCRHPELRRPPLHAIDK